MPDRIFNRLFRTQLVKPDEVGIVEAAQMPGAALEPAALDLSGMNEEARAFETEAFEKVSERVIEDLGIRQLAGDQSWLGSLRGYLFNYSLRQRNRAAISALFETTGGDWKRIREVAADGIRILRENSKDGMSAIPADHPFVRYLDALGELSDRASQEHSRDALVEKGWNSALLDKNVTGKARWVVVPTMKATTWGVNIGLGIVDWFLINQAIQYTLQSEIPGLGFKLDLPERVQWAAAALGALWISYKTIKHKATSQSFQELFFSSKARSFLVLMTIPGWVQYAAAVKAGAVSGGISLVATAAQKAGTELTKEVEKTRAEIDAIRPQIMPRLSDFYQTEYEKGGIGHGPRTRRITEATLGDNVARVFKTVDGKRVPDFAPSPGWNTNQFRAQRKGVVNQAEETAHKTFQDQLDVLAKKYGMKPGERLYHYIELVIERNKQKITLENAVEKLNDFVGTAKRTAAETSLPKEMSGGLPELIKIVAEVAGSADITWEQLRRAIDAFTHVAHDVSQIKDKFSPVKSAFLDIAHVLQKLKIAMELKEFTDDLAKIVPEVGSLEFKDPKFTLTPTDVENFKVEWGPFDAILSWSMWDRVTKDIPEELLPFVLQSIHEMNNLVKVDTRFGSIGPGPLAAATGLSFELQRDATGKVTNEPQIQRNISIYLWTLIAFALIGGGVIGVLDKKISRLTEHIDRGNRAAILSRQARRIGRSVARAFRNPIEAGEEVDIYGLLTQRGYRLRERDDLSLELAFTTAVKKYALSQIMVEESVEGGFPHMVPLSETDEGREFLEGSRREYLDEREHRNALAKRIEEIEKTLEDVRPANAQKRRELLRAIFDNSNIRNPTRRREIEIMSSTSSYVSSEPVLRRAVLAAFNEYDREVRQAEINERLNEIANLSAYRAFYDKYLVSTPLTDEVPQPAPLTAIIAARRASDYDAMIAYHRGFIERIRLPGEVIVERPFEPLSAREEREMQTDIDRVVAQNEWEEGPRPSDQLERFDAFRDALRARRNVFIRAIAERLKVDEEQVSIDFAYTQHARAYTVVAHVQNGENPIRLVYPSGAIAEHMSFPTFENDFKRWLSDDQSVWAGAYAAKVEQAYTRHNQLEEALGIREQGSVYPLPEKVFGRFRLHFGTLSFATVDELRTRAADVAEFMRISLMIPTMEVLLESAMNKESLTNEDHEFLMNPLTKGHKNVTAIDAETLVRKVEQVAGSKAFQIDLRRGVVIVGGREYDIVSPQSKNGRS